MEGKPGSQVASPKLVTMLPCCKVIKSGGEWISSIDMENHITAMPEVAQAAVVAAYHPKWEERPVAIAHRTAVGVHFYVFLVLSVFRLRCFFWFFAFFTNAMEHPPVS